MKDAFQSQLDQLGNQFSEVALILAEGNAEALPCATQILQSLSCEMLEFLSSGRRLYVLTESQRYRLSELSRELVLMRETLARRTALVNQAIEVVLPRPPKPTYGQSRGTFGSPFLQSGQIGRMSA